MREGGEKSCRACIGIVRVSKVGMKCLGPMSLLFSLPFWLLCLFLRLSPVRLLPPLSSKIGGTTDEEGFGGVGGKNKAAEKIAKGYKTGVITTSSISGIVKQSQNHFACLFLPLSPL